MTNPLTTNRLAARGLLAAALMVGASSAAYAQSEATSAVSKEVKPFGAV